MKKGKFGVVLPLYAVAAMILAMFGNIIPVVALTIFVIAVEKDEWASRQCIQASCVIAFGWIISEAVTILKTPFADWVGHFVYSGGYAAFVEYYNYSFSILLDLVRVFFLVMLLIGAIKVARGGEANIPLASKFANWAYGKVIPKPQPVYQQPQQPVYQQQPQQPVYQQPVQQAPVQQPVQQQPVQQAQAPVQGGSKFCIKCGAPLNGGAFCEKCGTKNA